MIWAILVLVAVILAVLEKLWALRVPKAVRLELSADKICAEPDEVVTWTAKIGNISRLPIPFVRLVERFPARSEPQGDPNWISRYCQKGIQHWNVEEKLSLAPRRSYTRSVKMKFSHRGQYRIGDYRISAGDLLGLNEEFREGKGQTIVIFPRRSESQAALQALGGFIGDISVRRFILEDPIMTMGFRDYTGREPMKSISWTRTAMTGALQVRQFDHTAEQHVQILLNVDGGNAEALEECFRLTRMACEELEQKKIPFGLRTNGNLPGPVSKIFSMAEGLGEQHLNTILYGLGRADYTRFYSFRYLVKHTLHCRRNNESYIVITPRLTHEEQAVLRNLEAAAGSSLCVLYGGEEVDAV